LPIISSSGYRAPLLFSNPHVQTVFPSVFRRVTGVKYSRTRIDTPDGDFLNLDTSRVGSKRVAIVLHGLEGDSTRSYVLGMAKALNKEGWDATALNFRGCGGECNKKLRFYHSGDTGDLQTVISHLTALGTYSEMALVGFSLGGNVVLKYLGEQAGGVPAFIRKAVAFSVPCDLTSSSIKLAQPANRLYLKRFLRMLRKKIRMKMALMPDLISDAGYESIKSFKEFDDRYTAAMHGFENAEDYWEKASSKPGIREISIPTLLINAADDPFLTEQCFPIDEARESPFLFLEIPTHGGHVGFVALNREGEYWSESRAVAFLNGHG
jgi:hypothetical protein